LTRRLLNPILILVSLDFLLAAGSFYLAYFVPFPMDIGTAAQYLVIAPLAITFALCTMLGLLAMGMYRARQRPLPWETAVRVLFGGAIGGFCYIQFFYHFPEFNTGRGALMGALTLACVAICAARLTLLPMIDQNPG
jgi:FlaA1/EpsC-like NDP-sugar epimerase